jgi:hypothetical protein
MAVSCFLPEMQELKGKQPTMVAVSGHLSAAITSASSSILFLLLFLVSLGGIAPRALSPPRAHLRPIARDAQNRARRTYGASAVGSFTVAAGTITGACLHYTYHLLNHDFYCF